MKMTSIAILFTPLLVLVGTAIAVVVTQGKVGIFNPGTHGFSEVLYAFSSAANNNGKRVCGPVCQHALLQLALGIAMWLGRFWIIVAGAGDVQARLPPRSACP